MSAEIYTLVTVVWGISVTFLGVMYIACWLAAVFHCKDRFILLIPFWFFMHNSFDDEGISICRRAFKISLVGGVVFFLGVAFGFLR